MSITRAELVSSLAKLRNAGDAGKGRRGDALVSLDSRLGAAKEPALWGCSEADPELLVWDLSLWLGDFAVGC